MVRHVASWKLLGCAVFTSVLLGASRADADSDSYPEDRVCADVQRMVGISSQGRGILDALAKVFGGAQDRKQAFAVAKQFEDVGRFADLVLGGSEPRLLEIQILDVTNVANRFSICDPPRWRFGDWGQRDALARHLWDRAKSLQPHDPAGATHLGKAAVALCAQDRFDSSPLGLFLRDPRVRALAPLRRPL